MKSEKSICETFICWGNSSIGCTVTR